ncbi:MAG: hypothetical protein H6835_05510 [Planctomycetes bacterium]|nr:hypothetical protein [Planctomycetota bacterium]
MRGLWIPALVVAACGCEGAPTPAVPIELQGADAAAIVRRCLVAPADAGAAAGCWRATADDDRAALLRRVLGEGAAAPADDPDVALVALVEPGGPRLERVLIGSEEGVDVLTLVLGAPPPPAAAARTAVLLWIERRPHQLAVVRRDVPADTEQTVGIFDGR